MQKKPKNKVAKIIKISFLFIAVLIIGGVIFIKYDTSLAAEFTDNVLRPVFGDNQVVYLEKIFFNLSDKEKRATQKAPEAPQFVDQGQNNTVTAPNNHLDLAPIPVNKDFKSLKDEGVWQNKPLKLFPGEDVMAYTLDFFRNNVL